MSQRLNSPKIPRGVQSEAGNMALSKIYDIFEGTEQIQQLVIARAISGIRIE